MRMTHARYSGPTTQVSAWSAPGGTTVNYRMRWFNHRTSDWVWAEVLTVPMQPGGLIANLCSDWSVPRDKVTLLSV